MFAYFFSNTTNLGHRKLSVQGKDPFLLQGSNRCFTILLTLFWASVVSSPDFLCQFCPSLPSLAFDAEQVTLQMILKVKWRMGTTKLPDFAPECRFIRKKTVETGRPVACQPKAHRHESLSSFSVSTADWNHTNKRNEPPSQDAMFY